MITGTELRHSQTLEIVQSIIPPGEMILDLGPRNLLAAKMKVNNPVQNTSFDLDEPEAEKSFQLCKKTYVFATAFEILEHLVEPARILRVLPCKYLLASVPIPDLFKQPYWNDSDPRDRHFHEFSFGQFDWLLEHCGYAILKRWKLRSYSTVWGMLLNWRTKFYVTLSEKNNENKIAVDKTLSAGLSTARLHQY